MTSGKSNFPSNASNSSLYNIDINKFSKNERYRLLVKHLQESCRVIQKQNERVAYRLYYVKKMTKRRSRDVARLKARLDSHNDGWRTAADPNSIKFETA